VTLDGETPNPWQPIAAVGENLDPATVDPYHWISRALSDGPGDQIPVSIELRESATVLDISGLTCRPAHDHARFRTGRATAAAFAIALSDPRVVRIRDATPLSMQRPPRIPRQPQSEISKPDKTVERATASGPLLAMIDSGCPFAHTDLRRGNGLTRIVRLWDQGSGARFGGLGRTPLTYDYGLELQSHELDAAISAVRDAAGQVDEDACYRRCGYWPAYGRTSHGAHSLGMMASDRRFDGSPWDVPQRVQRVTSPAGESDIVFVQLPAEVLAAISVAALEHHAFDAVRYIIDTARELHHDHVVISFGFESWIGPHDGTSWFEQGIDAMIEEAAANQLRVDFVTVAGNGADRAVHAECSGPGPVELTLHVPPDNEATTLVEIWSGSGQPDLTVSLAPPRGSSSPPVGTGQAFAWSTSGGGAVAAIASCGSSVIGTGGHLLVVRIGPTCSVDSGQAAAPFGVWRMTLSCGTESIDKVHAYVGRSENPPDGSRRGRQAVFVGHDVKPAGSLNGHAGGRRACIAGACLSHRHLDRKGRGREASYSGRGPLRGGTERPLDYLVAVDGGIHHKGLLGIGNRSAVVSRLSGTSVAAPLAARDRANRVLPPAGSPAGVQAARPKIIDP
jgi:hypothetical protein